MSQSNLPNRTSLIDNQSIHLPKNNNERTQLYRHIDQYIHQLKQIEGNDENIKLLNMRKKLISKHGLSMERIDNLESIFLHYCSHIFKTGKHMTFQRLEYEKSHMTLDRFFAFLKDFSLTTAVIDGVTRQVFQKNDLVLIFKKVSANSKDLNFELFISALERIAILFYDAKIHYKEKQQKLAKERKKRKQNYLKSMKRRKAAMEEHHRKQQSDQQNDQKLTSHEDNNEEEQTNKVEEEEKVENQNDNLVSEMLNDKNIVDPEQQLKEESLNEEGLHIDASEAEPQQEKKEEEQMDKVSQISDFNREELLELTLEQKIEYFYELINVDSANSFRKKMRELNLPLFQTKHRRATSHAEHIEPMVKETREPKQSVAIIEQKQRLEQLRQKIEERKQRDKHNSPRVVKEDYEERRQKRKVEQQQVMVKKFPRKKMIEVAELETDLSSLSKMQFDKINFRKFNPQKLYQSSQQDDIYLQQYYSNKKPQRSQKRILSSLQSNDKNSQVLLERLRKRAQQIQIHERLEQSKYSVTQDVNVSTQHQIRKNRLVQKLVKLQKV